MSLRLDQLRAQVRALLASDRVTAPTRAALQARMDGAPAGPRTLTPTRFAVLRAAAGRLVPLGDLSDAVDLAGRFDAQLGEGPGDGWRYAEAPCDRAAVEALLDALDAHAGDFARTDASRQDALLAAAQAGGRGWPAFAPRAFEDLLSGLCRLAYAHPLVQLDIGYGGMADAHGFQRVDPALG